jgi:hypothetical protein
LARADGFSLVEVMFALGVLTVGVLGAAGVLSAGMQNLGTSPSDVIVTQKATQAIEAVFAARDSHKLKWAQIRNVSGESGTDNGVFLDGPHPLTLAGNDGLVNTGDDPDAIESVPMPGADRIFNTGDDKDLTLSGFTREIAIRDVPGESGQLRSVTVTITFKSGTQTRTYKLSTYISAYS